MKFLTKGGHLTVKDLFPGNLYWGGLMMEGTEISGDRVYMLGYYGGLDRRGSGRFSVNLRNGELHPLPWPMDESCQLVELAE